MILVRQEEWQDLKEVETLLRQVFKQDEQAVLVNRLRTRPEYLPALSLVAVMDWKLTGYILFTPVTITEGEGRFQALTVTPLAVDPGFQRQGIGSRLVRMGLKEAARLGYSLVLAHHTPEYFSRFGFIPAEQQGIQPPQSLRGDSFQVLELTSGALADVSGRAVYPPEFTLSE